MKGKFKNRLNSSQIAGKHRNMLTVLVWAFALLTFLFLLFFVPPAFADANPNIGELGNASVTKNITLITGDTIVAYNITGKMTYSILPNSTTGLARNYQIIQSPQGTYFIPDNVDLKRVDLELFNVDYLLKEGYTSLSFIPVMMTLESIPKTKKGTGAQGIMGIDKNIKIVSIHKKIGVATAKLDKKHTGQAFDSLLASEEISKIWLDKKRHISLSDSVPLIGAPALWAKGYNGSGVKIAILDTGIDATHPDLDDIDDNPLTNDPKVLVQKNFVDWTYTDISDNTTADLYGHGTHVASIAAGTGEASGGLYKGVAPGAYLWNIRVLNKGGWGLESWIIDAINYSVYGADEILHTGDEADIISMSLGGGPTDGDDPMSRAVNSAVDAGVVVTIAAGNCGNFCISTPGAADKVITVGATDKSDVLAYFSSTGPTLDYRVKPDVVAPGVNIIAARASGTSMGSTVNNYYTSASGTSMATPHVAGAAALILQKAKNSITGWILEPPQHYNASSVSYNWIDGITDGTSGGIYGDDMATSAIDIGFNFTFYGKNYSKLYFSTNGLVAFDSPSTSYYNIPIPNPAQPNNFIAPFWDDLNVASGTGNTYYKLDASSNPKKFIITWKNVYKLGFSNPVTLQAVLFSNGSFLFQYQNISNIGVFDQTIGAENADGSEGVEYAYASPVVNRSAVMFVPKVSGIGKPKYVKNVLISKAKDLNLNVYEQGGGRIQIPNATGAQIIPDPATVSFKIIKGVNTSVIRFYNLNATYSRTLNLNVIVRNSSGNIVNAASLDTSTLTIAPNSSASILLTVNATSIPGAIYSGKLTGIADNSEKVGIIFGFSKLNKLTINKIKINGVNASYEPIWMYRINITDPNDYLSRFVSTNSNGIATEYVPDGKYNIWSLSSFNDTWIWTTIDTLSVTGDTSTTLDERISVPVSFDPNKLNQKFSSLYSVLDYRDWYGYSYSYSTWYPSTTTTRVTPTSVNVAHSYEYYPAAYYNSSDPGRINTPEWHKLYFLEQGISSPKNYVADYSRLVRRTGVYKTALVNESAWRYEWAMNKSYIACVCGAWGWQMDLPQQRTEYITPDTYYWGGLSAQNWSLGSGEYRSYPPASTPTESWNAQPFSWSHTLYRGSNWLYLYGYAFMDTGKHMYNSWPVPGNFTLYRNGTKIYNLSTNGYFWYYNYSEPSTANYSAVIEGASNQKLAVRSRTVLNFNYTGSGDYKPPKISWQIPKLDMYNRLPDNTLEINLLVVEEKEYGFVNGTPDQLSGLSLEYSINEGAAWNTVILKSLGNGEYNTTISGIPINTFVSLRTKAIDTSGNSASHEVIKAFLINVPTGSIIRISNHVAMPGSSVTVPVWLDNGSNVAGGSFKVTFNSSIARATRIDAGEFDTPTSNIDNASGFVYVAVARAEAIGKNKAMLANITFNVSSNVPYGAITALILGQTDLNDEYGSSVAHYTVNGQLKVEGVRGDINRNEKLDTGDATLCLRCVVGLPTPYPCLPIGDMNCNDRIDTGDCTLILRGVVNLSIPKCWEVLGNSVCLTENQASTVNMNIGESSIEIGQTVTLPVIITNSSEIAGGSVKILFNSSVAKVESVTPGDFGTPIKNIDNITGFVYIGVAGTTAIGKNEAILANITFRGEEEGKTPLNLTDAELNTEDGSLISPILGNGSIIVNGQIDNIPPQSITHPSLQAAGTTWLNFTWTNPPDPDYHHVMLYLNGSFKTSIPAPQNYYNFTGLSPDTFYELGTHTVDSSGNVNDTWVNATGRTLSSSGIIPPTVIKIESGYTPANATSSLNITALNVTDLGNFDLTLRYDPSVVNVTEANNNPVFGTSLNNLEQASSGMIRLITLNTGSGQSGDVLLSTLTLKAVGVSGQMSYLNLTVNTFVNSSEADIPVGVQNGTVTVGLPKTGDINGNGKLTLVDAIYLAKHVGGFSGYEIIFADGDINANGKVTLVDAIYLAKHVGGFIGYEKLY